MLSRRYGICTCFLLILVLNQVCCINIDCYSTTLIFVCFTFDGSGRTFEESDKFCRINGGILLEIYTKEVQLAIERFANNETDLPVWLNLVRTNSNLWIWGDQRNNLTYSNWEIGSPSPKGVAKAFMNSNYKWTNAYDPKVASTICIMTFMWLPIFNIKPKQKASLPVATTTTTWTTTASSTTIEAFTTAKQTNSKSASSSKTSPDLKPSSSSSSPLKKSLSSLSSSSSSSSSSTMSLIAPSSSLTTMGIGLGIGLGLGVLVLIIVSSLLVAKFVFHKEIPVPFKSSIKPPPYDTGSDVIKDVVRASNTYDAPVARTKDVISSNSSPPTYYNVGSNSISKDPHYTTLFPTRQELNVYQSLALNA